MSRYYNREEELIRIEIKDKVDSVRYHWSKKGRTDIFDILEQQAVIIKKPKPYSEKNNNDLFSGFTTYIDGHFFVYVNTAHSLGRQRFTAAHELYHLEFDKDQLTKKKVITEEEKVSNDRLADKFASEFLIPEEEVKKYFYSELSHISIQPEHVIRMMYDFKVSYLAMAYRLFSLGLITLDEYNALKSVSNKENRTNLLSLVRKQGLDTYLNEPTNESSISKKYLQYLFDNYSKNKISYGRLKSTLEYIGHTPEEFGFLPPAEPDYL
jgi:Zn-dependent peptidase ImmA (M78 family)